MIGAKPGAVASKLAALVPLGDNLPSATCPLQVARSSNRHAGVTPSRC